MTDVLRYLPKPSRPAAKPRENSRPGQADPLEQALRRIFHEADRLVITGPSAEPLLAAIDAARRVLKERR